MWFIFGRRTTNCTVRVEDTTVKTPFGGTWELHRERPLAAFMTKDDNSAVRLARKPISLMTFCPESLGNMRIRRSMV